MRFSSVAFLALFALGCPTNDAPSADPGAAGGVPPAGDAAMGGQPGQPGDPNQAGQPGPGGEAGAAGAPTGATTPPPQAGPPGFASLIQDGKSITISGTVTGAGAGESIQVDFTRVKDNNGQKAPEALELVKVTDGKFSVKAPATLDGDIYVSASVLDAQGAPGKKGGAAAAPIKLQGKDLTVDIKITDSPDWTKAMPWYSPDAPPPPNGGGNGAPPTTPLDPNVPAGGGTPAGPPPGGTGAPTPGAAPAAPTAPAAGGPG